MADFLSIGRRALLLPALFILISGTGILFAQEYDVKFYGLDVEADTTSDHIRGEATILAQVVHALDEIVLDLYMGLEVEEISVNGSGASFSHQEELLRISLGQNVAAGSYLDIRISYGGQTGAGMACVRDDEWGIPVTFTSTEPFFAKDWFPCKQDLEDKADSVHVSITTPYGLKGVSQGLLTATTYFPNGKVRHEWKSNYPVAYYLISIAVADYQEYNLEFQPAGQSDHILIQNFLYDVPGCLEQYREQIDMTIPIMELFHERFGPYPFRNEKYGHYLWPRGGGMEHQTMTGMGNFEFYLVAHELGHSWFGNYVTCGTWQDIWINEGFATFSGYMATEALGPEHAADEREYRFNRALLEPEGSVYVPAADADDYRRIFSGNLSYNKGMALVYMLRYELQDDDMFYRILREFISRYANSTATGMDFKALLEEISGMDFTDFFDQWYFGQGYPIFSASWEQDGTQLTLDVSQTGSSEQTPLFRMSMEYRLVWEGGDTIVRLIHDETEESYVIDVPGSVISVEIDPFNHVLNQVEEKTRKNSLEHMEIYPNPVKDHFTFRVSGLESVDESGEMAGISSVNIRLSLYSSTGRLVHSSFHEGLMPGFPCEVYPGILETGIYILHLESGSQTEIKKIIVE